MIQRGMMGDSFGDDYGLIRVDSEGGFTCYRGRTEEGNAREGES